MEAEKAKFNTSTLQALQGQLGTMNSQCDKAVIGADSLSAGVKEFANAAQAMKGMSGMVEELAKVVGQLKQGSSDLCANN